MTDMDFATECSVCIESFSKSKVRVKCDHCNFECCSVCVCKYLEDSVVTPQCMQCHHLWNHQFIRENFKASFVKKLADVRKSVLLNEQMAYFPQTQEFILLQKRLNELSDMYDNIRPNNGYEQAREQLRDISREIGVVQRRIGQFTSPFRNASYLGHETTDASSSTDQPTKKYIRTCGNGEECKGLVTADTNKCELCDIEYCPKCMEKMCEGHVCKKEDVLTIAMLQKDTKNCPKCTAMIHRISGCPDMFCVSCKTAFNWNTLKINERGNSNPHFYQWLRDSISNGNGLVNANDSNCGGTTTIQQMYASDNYRNLEGKQKDKITVILSNLHHYNSSYNVKKYYKEYKNTKYYEHDFQTITLYARADYMKNKITKEKFTQYLLKMNKAIEFNHNLDEILRSINIFRQHLIEMITHASSFDFTIFMTETKNFVKYINSCVLHLEEVFYTKKKYSFISTQLYTPC